MKAIIYQMECLTNLHAGSGEANYSVIDNEVQRDPVTGYPTIFASGIKGAIREYFKRHDYDTSDLNYLNYFGSEQGEAKSNEKGTKPGYLKFTQAHLLAFPKRVEDGDKPYKLVTSMTAKDELSNFTNLFQNNENLNIDSNCNEQEFQKLVKHLPVTARNQLDHGKSENLWYEEIVPHESIFWFAVLYDGGSNEEILKEFNERLLGDSGETIIQFGADASIGDGLCRVMKLYDFSK